MTIFPAHPRRSGALGIAAVAAWPVIAYSTVTTAAVDGCVRSHGIVGFLATHGAMMRPVPACPTGAVGHPEVIESALPLLLAAAILTTVAHVVLAAAGSKAAEWVHRFAEAVARIIAPVVRRARAPENFRPLVAGNPGHHGHGGHLWVPWRRGPPVGLGAALA